MNDVIRKPKIMPVEVCVQIQQTKVNVPGEHYITGI